MDIQQLLAAILNPNGSQQAQPIMGAPAQVGDHANPAALMQAQQRLAQPPQMQPQQQPMPQQAPQGQPMPQGAPQAPQQPQGGGLGGILQSIIAPQSAQKNQTVSWLTKQGLDQGTATILASDKTALRTYIMARAQGNDPMKALQAEKLGLEIEQMRHPQQGSDWSKMDDGRLFNQRTGAIRDVGQSGNGSLFEGTSVEAQSLNLLVKTGKLTPDQAAQLGAGKTVTNPADGSIIFLTPQGIFSQPAAGGPAQPVEPQGGPQPQPAPSPAGPASAPQLPSVRPGIIPLTEGKPGKLATEAETKNRALYTVIKPEADIVEKNFDALSNLADQAGGMLPGSDYITSPEYQRAKNSLKTIVASYLYSVSGATANPGEVQNQIDILTPKVGESKASIADKRARIKTMVDAVRQSGGNWSPNPGPGDPAAVTPGGQRVLEQMTNPQPMGGGDGWKDMGGGVRIRKID